MIDSNIYKYGNLTDTFSKAAAFDKADKEDRLNKEVALQQAQVDMNRLAEFAAAKQYEADVYKNALPQQSGLALSYA